MPKPEVTTDGRTVWVNSDGFCIGRFFTGFSRSIGEVLESPQGLRGVIGEGYDSWVARLKANWPNVEIDPSLRP